jgi:putative methyltransferase (TIGR04325 family)
MPAPVALFVYARPEHTRQTVEALQKNIYASETDLIVFSDAAAVPNECESVAHIRKYIDKIDGFKSLTIHHRQRNYGLAQSIISGVSSVLDQYGKVIVLEDDMITSRFFLRYMNEALDKFAEDDRVISIHGYMYPVQQPLPEAFFLQGADCWGWATWTRGWSLFNPDGQKLLDILRDRKLTKAFDIDGSYPYSKMLENQIQKKNDSWAVRWYASAFLSGKLTLYPGRSLVRNIGFDNSGTHCGTTDAMDAELSATPVHLDNVVVEESAEAKLLIKNYFLSLKKRSLLKCMPKSIMRANLSESLLALAKDCLPPLLVRWLRKHLLLRKGAITFEGPFSTWDNAKDLSSGYDSELILDRVLSATLKVKRGEAQCERDSVVYDKIQYSWPVTAGLMWSAARCGGTLNVLDFGGSLGSSYFQNRRLLEGLESIHWSVVEQPHFVKAGQKFIQDDQLFFYQSIAEAVSVQKPNVALLSSVLQYLSNPYHVLDELSRSGADIVIIDRTPFHDEDKDFFLVQNVDKSIYSASYPSRVFSKIAFMDHLSQSYCPIAECLSPEGFVHYSLGVFSFNTILLKRREP